MKSRLIVSVNKNKTNKWFEKFFKPWNTCDIFHRKRIKLKNEKTYNILEEKLVLV